MREDIPVALDYTTHTTNNEQGPRKGSNFIILGRSMCADTEESIALFKNDQHRDRKAPHYLVGRDGKLYKMADISRKAWHAGVDSRWKGFTNLNKYSVGIFLCADMGMGYTDAQYFLLNRLIAHTMKNTIHNHNPEIVLSHQDVRPWRHWGVGPEFEWYRLMAKNHAKDWAPIKDAQTPWDALKEYGYHGSKKAMVTAFQTRFMASTITGEMDALTARFIMGTP